MKVATIALNTYREAIRNKIVYSVVLFAAVIVGVSALFGAVTIGSQTKVISDFGLFSLSFFGAVITIITGVSLLNKEIKQKTVFNILSKPVHRWEFIVGKHLGLTITVTLLVSLMGIGLVGFTALFNQQVNWLLFQGVYFVLLEVVVVASVAMFFSSLVVTTTLTGIFTLGTYVAGRSIAYFQFFLDQRNPDYNPALAVIVKGCDWVLPDLSLFNVADMVVYGQSVSPQHALVATIYCLSYSTVALGLSALIFEKRELV